MTICADQHVRTFEGPVGKDTYTTQIGATSACLQELKDSCCVQPVLVRQIMASQGKTSQFQVTAFADRNKCLYPTCDNSIDKVEEGEQFFCTFGECKAQDKLFFIELADKKQIKSKKLQDIEKSLQTSAVCKYCKKRFQKGGWFKRYQEHIKTCGITQKSQIESESEGEDFNEGESEYYSEEEEEQLPQKKILKKKISPKSSIYSSKSTRHIRKTGKSRQASFNSSKFNVSKISKRSNDDNENNDFQASEQEFEEK